jgi:hypothetical protein
MKKPRDGSGPSTATGESGLPFTTNGAGDNQRCNPTAKVALRQQNIYYHIDFQDCVTKAI